MRSAEHFHSPCEKRFRQRRFHNFIKKIFIVVPLAVQNSLLFKDGSLEVVGNVRFVRIQSIRVVNLLIVDVHFNIGKKLSAKSYLHEWREELEPLPPPSRPLLLLPLFCFPFLLHWYCNFRNQDLWQVSVSKPRTSVSNQRISSNPFEIQTLCSFHRKR